MLDRSLIPPAESFYRREFPRLRRASRGWAMVRCVFPGHDDRVPSLSLNLREGNFVCHGCGVKGGDVIAFLQQRDGLTFRQACEQLRAWTDGTAESVRKMERLQRDKKRADLQREQFRLKAGRLRFELRDCLHTLHAIESEVSDRLRMSPGDDTCWHIFSLLHDEKRRTEAAYSLLAFGSEAAIRRYVTFPLEQEAIVDALLWSGSIVTEDKKFMELPA